MLKSAAGVTQRTHGGVVFMQTSLRSSELATAALCQQNQTCRFARGDGQDQLVPRVVEWWSSAAAARVVESTGRDGGEGWAGGPRVVATSGAPIHRTVGAQTLPRKAILARKGTETFCTGPNQATLVTLAKLIDALCIARLIRVTNAVA